MKRIVIAGGACGTNMTKTAEIIKEECLKSGIDVNISVHNLWESTHIDPRAQLVIQMFPFFRSLPCPIIDGRPFIHGRGEKELKGKIIELLKEE